MNDDLVQRLRMGAQEWNRLRSLNEFESVDFTAFDFTELRNADNDAYQFELVGFDFSGCNLERANIADGRLEQCDFTNARLVATRLWGSRFVECSFQGSTAIQTIIDGCEFDSCEFNLAEFGDSILVKSRFSPAASLDGVESRFESVIDLTTVRRSIGSIESVEERQRLTKAFVSLGFADELSQLM